MLPSMILFKTIKTSTVNSVKLLLEPVLLSVKTITEKEKVRRKNVDVGRRGMCR